MKTQDQAAKHGKGFLRVEKGVVERASIPVELKVGSSVQF